MLLNRANLSLKVLLRIRGRTKTRYYLLDTYKLNTLSFTLVKKDCWFSQNQWW